jgi:hypothetical protein
MKNPSLSLVFFLGEKSGMGSLTSTKTCMNPTKIREATHSPEIIQYQLVVQKLILLQLSLG